MFSQLRLWLILGCDLLYSREWTAMNIKMLLTGNSEMLNLLWLVCFVLCLILILFSIIKHILHLSSHCGLSELSLEEKCCCELRHSTLQINLSKLQVSMCVWRLYDETSLHFWSVKLKYLSFSFIHGTHHFIFHSERLSSLSNGTHYFLSLILSICFL